MSRLVDKDLIDLEIKNNFKRLHWGKADRRALIFI